MPKQMDDVIDEIHSNAQEDRERLTGVRDKIIENFDPSDQFARSAVADNVARLSDSLARINGQLLEIAKIRLKETVVRARMEAGSESDPDSMFDEIGDGLMREEDAGAN